MVPSWWKESPGGKEAASTGPVLGGMQQFGEGPADLLARGSPLNLPTLLQGSLWQEEAFLKEGMRDLPSFIKNQPLIFPAARKAFCNLQSGQVKVVPHLHLHPARQRAGLNWPGKSSQGRRDPGVAIYRFPDTPEVSPVCLRLCRRHCDSPSYLEMTSDRRDVIQSLFESP